MCQTKLLNVTESISSKLSYFTELENIGSKMTSLSMSGDRKDALLSTLTKLDQCILFIEKNVSEGNGGVRVGGGGMEG